MNAVRGSFAIVLLTFGSAGNDLVTLADALTLVHGGLDPRDGTHRRCNAARNSSSNCISKIGEGELKTSDGGSDDTVVYVRSLATISNCHTKPWHCQLLVCGNGTPLARVNRWPA